MDITEEELMVQPHLMSFKRQINQICKLYKFHYHYPYVLFFGCI